MVRRCPVADKEVPDPPSAPCPMMRIAALLESVYSVIFDDTE